MKHRIWWIALVCAAWIGQGLPVFAEEEPSVVMRLYSGEGAKELFRIVDEYEEELEEMFRSIEGLISYSAVQTDEGGFTVTICRDQAGIDESVRLAREWVAKRAAHVNVAAPAITMGLSITHFTEP